MSIMITLDNDLITAYDTGICYHTYHRDIDKIVSPETYLIR